MTATGRQLLRFRELVATLVGRELKGRYRGSLLGFLWSLVNPLLLLFVYSFVFGYVFTPARAGSTDPYAVFLVTGLFPWIWISTALMEGTVSLIANAGLIRKAVFPAAVLPVVPVLSNLVHFVLAIPVLVVALLWGRTLELPALLFPMVVLLQLPVLAGLSLGLAALNVHFKDVKDILTNLLTIGFFLTPILYPLEWITVPLLHEIVRWANPFTPFTLAYQQVLFYGAVPAAEVWIHMVATSLLAWLAGAWVFERLRDTLIEAV